MKNFATRTIMVADDFEDSRLMMRTLLEMNGYRVVEAADGQAALEVASFEFPDLILMDICLPGLDGIAAMRGIRERAELKHIPIIVVSGYDAAHFHAAAFAAGCAEYVVKPFDFDYMETLLKRFCPVAALPV